MMNFHQQQQQPDPGLTQYKEIACTVVEGNTKISKNNKIYKQYTLANVSPDGQTNLGAIIASCFEEPVIAQIDQFIGQDVRLNVRQNGRWWTILSVYGMVEKPLPVSEQKVVSKAHLLKPASPQNQAKAETHRESEQNIIRSIADQEPAYRVKVSQTAKGFAYWEVTVRSNDYDEIVVRLAEAVSLAQIECDRLNTKDEPLSLQQEEDIITANDEHEERLREIVGGEPE